MDEVLSQEEIDSLLTSMDREGVAAEPGQSSAAGPAAARVEAGGGSDLFGELDESDAGVSGFLSGPEIDALLSTLADAQSEVEASPTGQKRQDVKRYDFRRPHKFAKEQLRLLHRLNENFARALSPLLSGYLRLTVQLKLVSVDQMIYDEFIHSLPGLTILIVFNIDPPGSRAVLEINPSVVFPMFDRLLGGAGNTPPMARDLTDIERALMEGITTRSLGALRETWNSIPDLTLRLEALETRSQLVQVVSPHTPVVLATFEMRIRDVTGMMSLCLPDVAFESLIAAMGEHEAEMSARRVFDSKAAILQFNLSEVVLPLTVQLGCSQITMDEVLDLQIGDVIRLDRGIEDELSVLVGKQPKFLARPGTSRRHLAVQLTGIPAPALPGGMEETAEEEGQGIGGIADSEASVV